MKKIKKVLLAMAIMMSCVFVVMTSGAQAGLINGGFETGDLTGWVSSLNGGAADVVTSWSTYMPKEGTYFLKVQSGTADVWQIVSQDVNLNDGETLAGWAAFDWGDYPPFADGARVQILNAAGAVVATPYYMQGSTPSYADYPWVAWSWTAAASGHYTVELSARNTLDGGNPSWGLFDLQQSASVPEPATMLLLGIGLIGVVGIRRKFKG